MSLLPNAQAVLANGVLGVNETEILSFLISNAVGRTNAKSWKKINAHLRNLPTPIVMVKQDFQHGLLSHSRANNYFIGSSNRGFFIIDDVQDARTSAGYYRSRIQSETMHLSQLVSIGIAHTPPWII